MSQRFQIEDLVVQDNSGVVFRALDTETGQQVALRRFFPFGGKGGGLNAEEKIAYGIAVGRFAGVSHPTVRSVVCGGCDAIDGMPFIATEWVDGMRLQVLLDRRPLTLEEATHLLLQALIACQFLSQVLEEEAVWVETDPEAIVIGAEGSGRGATFWIAPLRLLGKNECYPSLVSIITLAEKVMSWCEKTTSDPVGGGLGSWLKWLRSAAVTTSFQEAHEMLVSSLGVKAPAPTKHLVYQAARPVMVHQKKKKKSSKFPLVAAACSALIAVGLGGWFLVKNHNATLVDVDAPLGVDSRASESPASLANVRQEVSVEPVLSPAKPAPILRKRANSVEEVNRKLVEMTAAAQQTTANQELQAHQLQTKIAEHNGLFTPFEHDLLLAQDGHEVIVKGILVGIGYSSSKKTMYLQFSENPATSDTCGAIRVKDASSELTESSLMPVVGKKVSLAGKVRVEKINNRPVIIIENRNAIKVEE